MRKKFIRYFVIILAALQTLHLGCRKIIPEAETDILFLGHRGGGGNSFNDVNIENTLNSVKQGFTNLDGVEIDLQMSKDGTIWAFHNFNVNDFSCETDLSTKNIPFLTDAEIELIAVCHKTKRDRIYKLSEIIDYWDNHTIGRFISLEVKIFFDPAFNEIGGVNTYFTRMANSLVTTLANVKQINQLFIEVNSKLFIDIVKADQKTKDIKCLLIRSGTLERKIEIALQEGYDGLSLNYDDVELTKETVKSAKNLGLYINLFTPYYKSEVVRAFEMEPNSIQVDNMDAKRYLNVK
jgi:glycerophosphoryl diester phosphodiesterase